MGVEVSEAAGSGELSEDLAEELLGVHVAGLAAPVVLVSARLAAGAEAGRAVRIVLVPLALVTQDLRDASHATGDIIT